MVTCGSMSNITADPSTRVPGISDDVFSFDNTILDDEISNLNSDMLKATVSQLGHAMHTVLQTVAKEYNTSVIETHRQLCCWFQHMDGRQEHSTVLGQAFGLCLPSIAQDGSTTKNERSYVSSGMVPDAFALGMERTASCSISNQDKLGRTSDLQTADSSSTWYGWLRKLRCPSRQKQSSALVGQSPFDATKPNPHSPSVVCEACWQSIVASGAQRVIAFVCDADTLAITRASEHATSLWGGHSGDLTGLKVANLIFPHVSQAVWFRRAMMTHQNLIQEDVASSTQNTSGFALHDLGWFECWCGDANRFNAGVRIMHFPRDLTNGATVSAIVMLDLDDESERNLHMFSHLKLLSEIDDVRPSDSISNVGSRRLSSS
eukprot:TRINITY_DN32932_c0_g1_i1.p1 TRINITY_DN32932_c0_g1~~TRINITY_DN32932_c0_g1_i1.p1  ORF type:complete len:376 (+),score=46.83 TRINITY_DN32932_c0_g1_i1:63-1190(+)